jgi:hypothetical protein
MPFAIIHHFPGGTKEMYEATVRVAHGGLDVLPPGQLIHAAGAEGDGWTVMAVYETEDAWVTFRDTVLMPSLQAGIEGAFTTPPEERTLELSTFLK